MNDALVGSTSNAPKSKKLLLAGGTIAALAVGGLGLQWWKAQSSHAQETGKSSVKQAAGTNAGNATAQSKREAAAKVTMNSRSISIPLDEVFRECALRVGNEVIESMINRAVIQLACEQAKVQVTEAEVEQEIVNIAKQFNIPTATWVEMLRTERNISPEQYKRDVIWPMLALKKLAGDNIKVTEQDMQKAFVRHYGSRVKCRMIMFENIRHANDCFHQLELKPDDFPRLAREKSIDQMSRSMEGAVPPIARYSGNPELEEAAFRLKEGDVSGVIHIGLNRYVILKCEGFTEQKVKDINEVRDVLHKDLVEEKVQESVAKLFDNLKKGARVDNYWNNTTTGDVKQVSGQQPAGGDRSAVRPAAGESSTEPGSRPSNFSPTGSTRPAGTSATGSGTSPTSSVKSPMSGTAPNGSRTSTTPGTSSLRK